MTQLTDLTAEQVKDLEAENGLFAWEMRAARGEGGWICASCCQTFAEGMPDACPNNASGCTEIIQRDKRWAQISKEVQ